jgi:Protein of unknown function (DUF3833)
MNYYIHTINHPIALGARLFTVVPGGISTSPRKKEEMLAGIGRQWRETMRSMFIGVLVLMLSGCAGIDMRQFENNTPKLDLYQYLQGDTTGWGIVLDRGGRLTRQFVVTIDGRVDDRGHLQLVEDFAWSDGEKSQRIWRIGKEGNHSYVGSAGDVVGTAQGLSYGNVLNWEYVLAVESGESTWNIDFDDWMFLQPDDVLINKTTLSKFGIHVGEVIIVFRKDGKDERR